ncbi:hypothetical protein ACJJTC_015036 [Scirpophaga incertulas]
MENFSGVDFNTDEKSLLNRGLKYCPNSSISDKDLDNLAVDLDLATVNPTEKHVITKLLRQEKQLQRSHGSTAEQRVLRDIKRKVKENNLIITRADKGNTVVVTKREDYIAKVDQFLCGSLFMPLKKDPTKKFNEAVKGTLQSAYSIFTKDTFKLKIMNPQAPKLQAYYKLHKPNVPIRPVVTYRDAPAYKLAAETNNIFKKLTGFQPAHTIKNSLELLQKIQYLQVPEGAILVSFDVVNLFPNIPLSRCKAVIKDILFESVVEPQNIIDLEHTISMLSVPMSVPMSEKDFNEELCVIKTVAVNNGYSSKLINVILKKKEVQGSHKLSVPGSCVGPCQCK